MARPDGYVSLWHPWFDKKGIRHSLTLWHPGSYPSDIDSLVRYVAGLQQYVLCTDLLDPLEIPLDLLKHDKAEPYMSRSGHVVALRVRAKKSGFFIPSATWGYKKAPDERLREAINEVFHLFDFEGITPSSLSEKVLRSTLPEKLIISRPSHTVRKVLLENHIGGRIDKATRKRYRTLYEYDEVKAYLYHSQCVVSPYNAPAYLLFSSVQDDRYRAYATAYLLCTLSCHCIGIQPIQIKDEVSQDMRQPRDGEIITRWMWLEELDDCLEAGYTLEAVYEAFCWSETSNFMEIWANVLWNVYIEQKDNLVRDILKHMMVGLPGRFLKSPEIYTLVHQSEGVLQTDIPIGKPVWNEGAKVTTPWFLRASFDLESTALTPVGSYIVMKCRQELYHRMKAEEQAGNTVVSSYIDCYTTTEESKLVLGEQKGAWKEKQSYLDVWAVENQVIPHDIEQMRAPGVSGTYRKALYEMYHSEKEKIHE